MTKVLVLGGSGMLGNATFRYLSEKDDLDVYTTVRSMNKVHKNHTELRDKILTDVNVLDADKVGALFANLRPDVVINCVGLIKQLDNANDPLQTLPINAMLPHRLSNLCSLIGARLIHISTDCVFSGNQGAYLETDLPDALDLYGRSKLMGEIHDSTHAITLRTSIIGHEIGSSHSLIDWFLGAEGEVNGFKNAFYSGLPTVELARVIYQYVIPNNHLHGLYHVSSETISKYDLLCLVRDRYQKNILINEETSFKLDRSMNSDRFRSETGYNPPSWEELVKNMHAFG